jgi:hypothetical protein
MNAGRKSKRQRNKANVKGKRKNGQKHFAFARFFAFNSFSMTAHLQNILPLANSVETIIAE